MPNQPSVRDDEAAIRDLMWTGSMPASDEAYRKGHEALTRLVEQLQTAQRQRDEAVATMREIQRKYVRTDKA